MFSIAVTRRREALAASNATRGTVQRMPSGVSFLLRVHKVLDFFSQPLAESLSLSHIHTFFLLLLE